MRSVRVLNWLSLTFLVLVVGADLLFLGVATLFFDDPHADYGEFVRFMLRPVAATVLVVVAGQAGSRVLARAGRADLALAAAALTVPVAVTAMAVVMRW